MRNAIQYLPRPKRYWLWAVLLLAIPILGLILSIVFWDWLSLNESRGTTVRNVGLIIAALTALPLAIWRGLVAEKQADAAQKSLRNERYQKGAEMLGSEVLSVRLGGIYALQRLAKEYPEEYHVQIMGLFCTFVRDPKQKETDQIDLAVPTKTSHTQVDIREIVHAIGARSKTEIKMEQDAEFRPDLSGSDLSAFLLMGMDLSNAFMYRTDLSHSVIGITNLLNAYLYDANLSGALISGIKGLTQRQLDQARADPYIPPDVTGVFDAETGQPLVWTGGRGAPLKDDEEPP